MTLAALLLHDEFGRVCVCVECGKPAVAMVDRNPTFASNLAFVPVCDEHNPFAFHCACCSRKQA